MSQEALHSLRKKRGVTRASVTKIGQRLRELEANTNAPDVTEHAQRHIAKLQTLAAEFKTQQHAVIDLIDGEEALAAEQEILDNFDDEITRLHIGFKKFTTSASSKSSNIIKVSVKRLKHLNKIVSEIADSIMSLSDDDDNTCLLQQHQEQLTDIKGELSTITQEFLSADHEDTREFDDLLSETERDHFNCSLKIRKLLQIKTTTAPKTDRKSVKLPKLDVPTFDGDILNWTTFWEQFDISIHSQTDLPNAEKLAYLRNAVGKGNAKQVIEGLSKSGDQYEEAIACLKARYDKPRLIHQAHVRKIVEMPNLKDGTGKELRRLHDTAQQHLRALKAMGCDPDGAFITSMLELKFDAQTMFEWQQHSSKTAAVPPYQTLLDFVNLRAQAYEFATTDVGKRSSKNETLVKKSNPVTSFAANADSKGVDCVSCHERHPLFLCSKFKSMTHEQKRALLKSTNLCLNCLKPGHIVKHCRSLHKCHVCQKPHHTLLHIERNDQPSMSHSTIPPTAVSSHIATKIQADTLLMTCRIQIKSPNGMFVTARALLDSASSASFVSERLAQALNLPRSRQYAYISGIAGLTKSSPIQSITNFSILTSHPSGEEIDVTAIVIPKVTRDLPLSHIAIDLNWNHLNDITLADPDFAKPSRIDLLLGVEIFVAVLLQGRKSGPPGSPLAVETKLGWVLAGNITIPKYNKGITITSNHTLLTGDDLLRKFWEIEEKPMETPTLTPEENTVIKHFESHHARSETGRFIVPLAKRSDSNPLGESRTQAVRRFLHLERSLRCKGSFPEFKAVIDEYFSMGHAEAVPEYDMRKPPQVVFYLPMQAVLKESSTTSKVRAVFDASAKTSTGVSLNDTLLVGPTVHSSLVDVLLRFRLHRIALVADVSRMYRAIELAEDDKDLHRFVWRNSPSDTLMDFRMTRVTFGVSASSFIANMCVKQNAIDNASEYPLAAQAVKDSFYVDDGLTGAESIETTIKLQQQLQKLFEKGGFLLRKWNSSETKVLEQIDPSLLDQQSLLTLPQNSEYTKTLGVEWNSNLDQFRIAITNLSCQESVTKRAISSDIARIFDVLGWMAPVIIKAKLILQRLWEEKVHWDDIVPEPLKDMWLQWRKELPILMEKCIPRCYFPKQVNIKFKQLHGFCDASEQAYAGVVYLRMVDTEGDIHTSLVLAKTKVAPIKRLSIPRLELCGAQLLAQILHHCQVVLNFPTEDIFAWTDSTIVLSWIYGNPRQFETYVGNRVSHIIQLIAPSRWNHIEGVNNPADCASRGLLPSELISHQLWWEGPDWLQLGINYWPEIDNSSEIQPVSEMEETCFVTVVADPIFPCDHFSNFTKLLRVTAWIYRFMHNCQACRKQFVRHTGPLIVEELEQAQNYWLRVAQLNSFNTEIAALQKNDYLPRSSLLVSLNPFLDDQNVLRVGGREQNSQLSYNRQHPVILHGTHPLSKLIIHSEHLRLLHAGPTLTASSLNSRFHLIGGRRAIRSITRSCVTCRRRSVRPKPPIMGQLPRERITPDSIFSHVGIDYAGPIYIKHGYVRKPITIKAYICVFVSLSIKAVHIELVSDMTTEAFLACLRRFIARRGKPILIWSDHGTNFVGATRQLKELYEFLQQPKTNESISNFCTSQRIKWEFIPERAPHFGGLWEAAVKSIKKHLNRIVGTVTLTFEEMITVLTQIEACLNSRPLTSLPCDDDGGQIHALTPGHFLIGRPLEALPNHPDINTQPLTVLKRWYLCQGIVKHFWKRWSNEYLQIIQKSSKWQSPSRNLSVGDIVILCEDNTIPSQWPLARIVKTHPGKDGIVRVVTVQTSSGNHYNRPVVKIAPLLFKD